MESIETTFDRSTSQAFSLAVKALWAVGKTRNRRSIQASRIVQTFVLWCKPSLSLKKLMDKIRLSWDHLPISALGSLRWLAQKISSKLIYFVAWFSIRTKVETQVYSNRWAAHCDIDITIAADIWQLRPPIRSRTRLVPYPIRKSEANTIVHWTDTFWSCSAVQRWENSRTPRLT